MPFLYLDSLYFSYGRNPVLHGVSLSGEKGDIIGILGRNGCGKTTFFNCLAGILKSTNACIRIDEAGYDRSNRGTTITYLPQVSFLPGNVETKKAVRFFYSDAERLSCLDGDQRIESMYGKKIGSLSKGERRYLEINLILMSGKPLCILDEPFSALEPLYYDKVNGLIREAAARACILVSDHNHGAIDDICTRVYGMTGGQLHPEKARRVLSDDVTS